MSKILNTSDINSSKNGPISNLKKFGMIPKQGSFNNRSFVKRETVTKESILNKNKPKSAIKDPRMNLNP